ncbi:hypothetical protein MIB92_02645 [Aestuariirhabdus sp. Z084]|nr:hypothetical protein [Aestuariirhabdus haliotis]MCL6418478.1 hypothetical protein [Aestuariirhabdus haliotis]
MTPEQPRVDSADLGGGTYTTSSNDTLWEIAATNRPSRDVSIQQTMVAIQQINPDAFIKQNINLLKKGQVLRLPNLDEVERLTQRQAIAEVAVQNQQWRDQRNLGAPQLDASRRDSVESETPKETDDGKLSLASASQTGENTSGSDSDSAMAGADTEALQNELAITQEKLDKALRESGETSSQLGELEEQIETLQRLLSLKDEQLAALQAQLATQSESPEEVDYNYAEEPVDAGQQPAVTPESGDSSVAVPMPKPEPKVEEPTPEPKPEPVPPKPEVAKPTPVVEEPSLLDQVLQNPIYLAAAGGVVVLLVGLGLMARRRSAGGDDQSDDLSQPVEQIDEVAPELDMAADSDASVDERGAEEELSLDGDLDDVSETTTAQTGDAIGEADIYIAYGRYNQAVELLTNAIVKEPSRSDLRVKLLEAYAEMKDAPAFVKQENELSALGDSIAMQEAESLKAKFPAGALEAAGSGVAGAEGLDVDDLDEALSLDDLSAGEDAAEFSLDDLEVDTAEDDFMQLAGSDAEDSLDFGLDSKEELSLDDPLELDSSLDVDINNLDEVDDNEFTLDNELTLDAENDEFDLGDLEAGITEEPDAELDLSLGGEPEADDLEELGLDLTEDLAAEAEVPAELDDEFDLSLDDPEAPAEESLGEELFDASDDKGLPDIEFELGDAEEDLAADLELEAEPDLEVAMDADVSVAENVAEPAKGDLDLSEIDSDSADDFDQLAEGLASGSDMAALDAATESLASEFEVEGEDSMDEEFDFLAGTNETSTKLDLARAYVDMGDVDGARDILEEVLKEGDEAQLKEAQGLLDQIG